eukprot:1621145-Pyramimonas_sp.AAC.1
MGQTWFDQIVSKKRTGHLKQISSDCSGPGSIAAGRGCCRRLANRRSGAQSIISYVVLAIRALAARNMQMQTSGHHRAAWREARDGTTDP